MEQRLFPYPYVEDVGVYVEFRSRAFGFAALAGAVVTPKAGATR
jgi:hypothetical protein